jgi:hypothetical protein
MGAPSRFRQPPAPRHWGQFSLWTLLVVTNALGIFLWFLVTHPAATILGAIVVMYGWWWMFWVGDHELPSARWSLRERIKRRERLLLDEHEVHEEEG